jgi:hypothetical protein
MVMEAECPPANRFPWLAAVGPDPPEDEAFELLGM